MIDIFIFIVLCYMDEWFFSFVCCFMLSYMNGITILGFIVVFIVGM